MGEEGWRANQSACFPRMPGQCRTRATVPSAWLPREMGAIFDSVGIRKRLQLGDPHRVYHFFGLVTVNPLVSKPTGDWWDGSARKDTLPPVLMPEFDPQIHVAEGES